MTLFSGLVALETARVLRWFPAPIGAGVPVESFEKTAGGVRGWGLPCALLLRAAFGPSVSSSCSRKASPGVGSEVSRASLFISKSIGMNSEEDCDFFQGVSVRRSAGGLRVSAGLGPGCWESSLAFQGAYVSRLLWISVAMRVVSIGAPSRGGRLLDCTPWVGFTPAPTATTIPTGTGKACACGSGPAPLSSSRNWGRRLGRNRIH